MVKILVAMHKDYWVPDDNAYIPVHVGAKSSKVMLDGLTRDDDTSHDDGEISEKNYTYCEMTAVYWAWKNLNRNDEDYIGLCHYRRYFGDYNFEDVKKSLYSKDFLEKKIVKYDIVAPREKKIPQSVYKNYITGHYREDIECCREVVKELYPEYGATFDAVMDGRRNYFWNMFIMKNQYFNEYCQWMFDILFEAEKRIDFGKYKNASERRVMGYLAERLTGIWFKHNSHLLKLELDVVNLEGDRPSKWCYYRDKIRNSLQLR